MHSTRKCDYFFFSFFFVSFLFLIFFFFIFSSSSSFFFFLSFFFFFYFLFFSFLFFFFFLFRLLLLLLCVVVDHWNRESHSRPCVESPTIPVSLAPFCCVRVFAGSIEFTFGFYHGNKLTVLFPKDGQ